MSEILGDLREQGATEQAMGLDGFLREGTDCSQYRYEITAEGGDRALTLIRLNDDGSIRTKEDGSPESVTVTWRRPGEWPAKNSS